MKILEELYYGNIAEISRKLKKWDREKEGKLYDEIKELLPEEKKEVIDEFIDELLNFYDEQLIDKYIQGFKTGTLIGLEIANIDL